MIINLSTKNSFKLPELELPTNLASSTVFNKIFKEGISLVNFEEYYKSISKSQIEMQSPHFNTSTQYNLKTDLWGPKEIILFSKGKRSGVDVAILYGLRDTHEFTRVVQWLDSLGKSEIVTNTPGNRVYNYRLTKGNQSDTKSILFNVVRDSEQTSKVSLFLTF